MIDTHSHIYSEEFDLDSDDVVQRAVESGIRHIILPNIDSEYLHRMLTTEQKYPEICHAAIGLHPTSVRENYKDELKIVKSELKRRPYIAIGEIGMDLYWDKTFVEQQKVAFEQQLQLSLDYQLPVIIHVRDSFDETFEIIEKFRGKGLKGIFHSFTGTEMQAKHIIEFGNFVLGINGVVTFKNSGLSHTLSKIDIDNIVLETDAPYLTPVPFRGKRNEPAYMTYTLKKLSEIYNIEPEKVAQLTDANALKVFPSLIVDN